MVAPRDEIAQRRAERARGCETPSARTLSGDDGLGGLVDPGDGGELGGCRWPAESFGVGVVGGGEDLGPGGLESWCLAVVDVGWGVQSEGGVVVDVVVVPEEGIAEGLGMGEAAEAVGEAGAVLERLELGFAVG